MTAQAPYPLLNAARGRAATDLCHLRAMDLKPMQSYCERMSLPVSPAITPHACLLGFSGQLEEGFADPAAGSTGETLLASAPSVGFRTSAMVTE
jgi:hypothetical protein